VAEPFVLLARAVWGVLRLPLWDLRFSWHTWRMNRTKAAAQHHARRIVALAREATVETANMDVIIDRTKAMTGR
jgi:hypothetical protein